MDISSEGCLVLSCPSSTINLHTEKSTDSITAFFFLNLSGSPKRNCCFLITPTVSHPAVSQSSAILHKADSNLSYSDNLKKTKKGKLFSLLLKGRIFSCSKPSEWYLYNMLLFTCSLFTYNWLYKACAKLKFF